MVQQLYTTGLTLSKNYVTRTKEEDSQLYEIIQFASTSIVQNNTAIIDKSLQFLALTFEPLIKKLAYQYHSQVSHAEEYEDVLQEVYTMFITLVYKYNPERASFSYYIHDMLPRYMYSWVQKIHLHSLINCESVEEYALSDPYLKDQDSVYDIFDSLILAQEYEEFILNRATRNVRSNTVPQVCYHYFLDKKTCSEIAVELGISYQAVREVINKIKKELKEFFSDNLFTDYISTDLNKILNS